MKSVDKDATDTGERNEGETDELARERDLEDGVSL